jgi:hypothetical protein
MVAPADVPDETVPIESVLAGPVGPVLPGAPCGPWSAEKTTEVCGSADSIITSVSVVVPGIVTVVVRVSNTMISSLIQ